MKVVSKIFKRFATASMAEQWLEFNNNARHLQIPAK
jgi:hypothetical protein